MRTKEFLSKLDHDLVVQAIRDAEAKTSGEIRVYIQRGKLNEEPLAAAQKRFQKLGMHRTRERNAVLIFIAPRAHQFAVIGDQAIHEKCGDALWQGVVTKMREHFVNERFSQAMVDAVHELGATLTTHFPRRGGNVDELPNSVIEE
jgi:uncharacterized membrane protein